MVMDLLIFWDSGAPSGLGLPVSRCIGDLFALPAQVRSNPLILNGYDGSRNQTDAHAVLDSLGIFRQRQAVMNPILLVCGADLFTAGVTSLFGLSRPRSLVAVVSTARLDNRFYDLPENEEDLVDRLVKESAHEIGHLFMLEHCDDSRCIMFPPLTLDDLDRKKRWFCPSCQAMLEGVTLQASI